ncbi:MAG: pectate lyase [Ignavibacteriae bacterium]|nr:pectate lyase [Ignavibacteriota bacterium]
MKSNENLYPPIRKLILLVISIVILPHILIAQYDNKLKDEIILTMKHATKFFADSISEKGGYLSHYLPDLSRRWGELEAYPTMVWTQNPGTVSMGNTFLDAYFATNDEYYYLQAKKAANALKLGQLSCGGWNYFINFDDENSTINWYNTVGKNAWRLEEFQHYYGNATFDDETTSGAAFFLLRFYLTKFDSTIRPPLEAAISLILKSQYPLGGWPQRFPLMNDFVKDGHPDYTSFYTFNDNVIWQNIKFLIACYSTLPAIQDFDLVSDHQLLDAIKSGMEFILLSQQPKPFAGWSQQYNMDLEPAGARTYEPESLDPQYTAANIKILLKCYELTGEKKYLERIPDAINWLDEAKLKSTSREGIYVYAKFVDPKSGKPLFTHRLGTNVNSGHYYVNEDSSKTPGHYRNFRLINLKKLKNEYQNILTLDSEKIISNSPLFKIYNDNFSLIKKFDEVTEFLEFSDFDNNTITTSKNMIEKIISALDDRGRWLVSGLNTSNPYIGDANDGDSNSKEYMTTNVGDKFDTSPYRDKSDQKYISTAVYSFYMKRLIEYLKNSEN